jgi:hypothetical protein
MTKNSMASKNLNLRIAEIHEAIPQIKIHLSEIECSNEINPIIYLEMKRLILKFTSDDLKNNWGN